MEEKGKQISRREFIDRVGMGVAALGTLPATQMFAAGSRVIGANDRIRIGIIGAGDRGQQDLKSALAQPNANVEIGYLSAIAVTIVAELFGLEHLRYKKHPNMWHTMTSAHDRLVRKLR